MANRPVEMDAPSDAASDDAIAADAGLTMAGASNNQPLATTVTVIFSPDKSLAGLPLMAIRAVLSCHWGWAKAYPVAASIKISSGAVIG